MINPQTNWDPLWPAGAPLALGTDPKDTPALRFSAPTAMANGAAMVVLPGGGYGQLAVHEGEDYAHWLAGLGYAVFELRYRLATSGYRHPVMEIDAARALRKVRFLASEKGYSSDKIGIMGSSAGGHLAGLVSVKNDEGDLAAEDLIERMSSRPDLAVLCYPVIALSGPQAHRGSGNNLLGDDASEEDREALSLERLVTAVTPPCFLWHTVEDRVVPVENSLDFAAALRRADVKFELHIYEKGGHGLGLANGHPWTVECERWLRENFLVTSKP